VSALPYAGPIVLDERLPAALRRQLAAHLDAHGSELTKGPAGPLSFTTPDGFASPGARPAVVFFDGTLRPSHAAALVGERRALLVACRGPEGTLAPWELAMLWAYLTQDSLIPPGADGRRFKLQRRDDIQRAASETLEFVRRAGGANYASAAAADVMHEMAANALLDAPANSDGSPRYAHRRDQTLEVAPEDAAYARVVVADRQIYIQAADHAGRLTPDPIAAALRQLGGKLQLNLEGGGAGIGMFRIIDQSDVVCFRVARGRLCEATSVLTLEEVRRRSSRPKSLWFMAVD
jgi:hypothetical protein